tara:strand:+ start:673 stop:1368 length:696 start_codon:yes stop_codon:yes gene_type:complete
MSKNKNNKKKINIFFDFANTICFLKKRRELILSKFLKKFKIQRNNDELVNTFKKADEKFFYSELNKIVKKKKFYVKYNRFIQKRLKLNFIKNFSLDYYYYVKNIKNNWIIDKETIKILRFKQKKYNFYLASNFSLYAFKILNKYKIRNIFKEIYISKDIGLEKPNKNFYKYIINHSQVIPRDSYFIGDNYILDHKIPRLFKFKTALLTSCNEKRILNFKNLKSFFKYIEKK